MPFPPPSTNAAFEGPIIAAWALFLLGLLKLVPGLIHTFLPDGGAGVIAGVDLTVNGAAIVKLFAWAGATQIVFGAMLITIALRYRNLVPIGFAALLIEYLILAWTLWGPKGQATGHYPPAAYAALILLPIILGLLFYSNRNSSSKGPSQGDRS